MKKSNYQSFILILAVLGMLLDVYLWSNVSILITAKDTVLAFLGVVFLALIIYGNILFYKFIIKQLNR